MKLKPPRDPARAKCRSVMVVTCKYHYPALSFYCAMRMLIAELTFGWSPSLPHAPALHLFFSNFVDHTLLFKENLGVWFEY